MALTISIKLTEYSQLATQYMISTSFILFGLVTYGIGLYGAALESSTPLKVCGVFLTIEFIYWIILVSLSFSEDCTILRKVCVDNRCADTLFIQNCFWRPTRQECQGDRANITKKASESEAMEKLFQQALDEIRKSDAFAHFKEHENKELRNLQNLEIKAKLNGSGIEYESKISRTTIEIKIDQPTRGDPWTPIGPFVSNSKPHYTASVVFSVLIAILWYFYSILVIFSYASQIDHGEAE